MHASLSKGVCFISAPSTCRISKNSNLLDNSALRGMWYDQLMLRGFKVDELSRQKRMFVTILLNLRSLRRNELVRIGWMRLLLLVSYYRSSVLKLGFHAGKR
jgi:hypothetical protein